MKTKRANVYAFSRRVTVQKYLGDKPRTGFIEVEIDLDLLTDWLGVRCLFNKTRRTTQLHGFIKAKEVK